MNFNNSITCNGRNIITKIKNQYIPFSTILRAGRRGVIINKFNMMAHAPEKKNDFSDLINDGEK